MPGVTVTFAITCAPSGAADGLSPTSADTNAAGVATVNLTLSAVAGERCVTATAEGAVLGEIAITLEPGSLPNTSTSVPEPVVPLPAVLALAPMIAAVLVGWRLSQPPKGDAAMITSVTSATVAATSAVASWGLALGAGGVLLVWACLLPLNSSARMRPGWKRGLRHGLKIGTGPLLFVFAVSVIVKALASI